VSGQLYIVPTMTLAAEFGEVEMADRLVLGVDDLAPDSPKNEGIDMDVCSLLDSGHGLSAWGYVIEGWNV
jgi:hypothetical protein